MGVWNAGWRWAGQSKSKRRRAAGGKDSLGRDNFFQPEKVIYPFYPIRGMKAAEEDITGARKLRKNITAIGPAPSGKKTQEEEPR